MAQSLEPGTGLFITMAGLGRKDYLAVSPIERFTKKYLINPETQCWEWQSPLNVSGYGNFKIKQERILAHRFSYQFYIGEIPEGMFVCHRCDNRKCVSPFHLWIGTNKENINDAQNKGRLPTAQCPSRSMFRNGCRCDGCVELEREYQKQWRLNNAESNKRKQAEYYQNNREMVLARNAEYRKNRKC